MNDNTNVNTTMNITGNNYDFSKISDVLDKVVSNKNLDNNEVNVVSNLRNAVNYEMIKDFSLNNNLFRYLLDDSLLFLKRNSRKQAKSLTLVVDHYGELRGKFINGLLYRMMKNDKCSLLSDDTSIAELMLKDLNLDLEIRHDVDYLLSDVKFDKPFNFVNSVHLSDIRKLSDYFKCSSNLEINNTVIGVSNFKLSRHALNEFLNSITDGAETKPNIKIVDLRDFDISYYDIQNEELAFKRLQKALTNFTVSECRIKATKDEKDICIDCETDEIDFENFRELSSVIQSMCAIFLKPDELKKVVVSF